MKNKLFVMHGCPHCRTAQAFLAEAEAVFVEYDVTDDVDALRALLTLTGRNEVPTLVAGYQAVVGFNRESWSAALEHAAAIEREDPYELPASLGEDPYKDQ